ncbi:MAG: NrfD/PsrC family molybdoenzyme membrane anchor subunit [Vulcanimicrobiota bacterium]
MSWLAGQLEPESVSARISGVVLQPRHTALWWCLLALSGLGVLCLCLSLGVLFYQGVGVWGVNRPAGWGLAIVNFVWWIGIGHAGTLISAILYLARQPWRTSINRFAEAMTLFAVCCAGLFPILHLGRPWYFYWLAPYPNRMHLWPQWRSPLIWDFFAVSTYLTVSLLFWYLGLVPDLAVLRDRAQKLWQRRLYGLLALGWRGSSRHWAVHQRAYLLLACLATPLVVSVHSIVALDFAAGVVPGWHSTIFPPFFVAGAIFSGFAMVTTLIIPLRSLFDLRDFISHRHLDAMAKMMLLTSILVTYGYLAEGFTAWYSGQRPDIGTALDRFQGAYAWIYYTLIFCNSLAPLVFFWPAARRNTVVLLVVSILINIGMWTERFIIVVQSLTHDFLPAAWRLYVPTRWDWCLYLGTFGLFSFLMLLFIRFLPALSISELSEQAIEERNG